MKIKIFLSKELRDVLEKVNCKASSVLLSMANNGIDKANLITDFGNYVSISKEDKKKLAFTRTSDVIKYSELPESTVVSTSFVEGSTTYDFWKKRRNSISPGRIFSRILTPEYLKTILSESDLERFSNNYVAEMDNQLEFELVKGEDIRTYYLRDKYSQKFGTSGNPLWQSCMNSDSTQKFLDIYAKNPDSVSLLIVKHPGGVVARALVWHNVEIYDVNKDVSKQTPTIETFMDRCYYAADWILPKMTEFAKRQGWYSRAYHRPQDYQVMLDPKGNMVNRFAKIKLQTLRLENFPYIDTFFMANYKDSSISNAPQLAPGGDSSDKILRQTSGFPNSVYDYITNQYIRKSDAVWIKNKVSYYNKSNAIFSDKSKDFFLKDECKYSKLDNEYITPDEDVANCVVTGILYKKGRMLFSNHLNGMVHKKESVDTVDSGIVHKSMAVWSKTCKANFLNTNVVKIEAIDDFLPKELLQQIDEKQLLSVLSVIKKYEKEEKVQTDSYVFEF